MGRRVAEPTCIALLGFLLWAWLPAPGLRAAEALKIAFFDFQRVMMETEFGKAAKAKLEAMKEAGEQRLTTEQGEVQRLQRELSMSGGGLSAAAKREKEQAISKKTAELQSHIAAFRQELGAAQSHLLEEMGQDLTAVVAEYAREKRYDLILEKHQAGIFFGSDSLDVTGPIIERLDAKTRSRAGAPAPQKTGP
jgi:outer membrane protein